MKIFALLPLLFAGANVHAGNSKRIICLEPKSKLTLQASDSGFEGSDRYNRMPNGRYASYVGFECEGRRGSDLLTLDCSSMSMGVYWSVFKLPRNAFQQPAGTPVRVLEIHRGDDGEVENTEVHEGCRVQ